MTTPKPRPRLTAAEITAAFAEFPQLLSPAQLAKLLGVSSKTVYFWLASGRLDAAARKRGKHWLVLRDKAIDTLMNGANWNHDCEDESKS